MTRSRPWAICSGLRNVTECGGPQSWHCFRSYLTSVYGTARISTELDFLLRAGLALLYINLVLSAYCSIKHIHACAFLFSTIICVWGIPFEHCKSGLYQYLCTSYVLHQNIGGAIP